jgi:hypothetical protein
MWSRRFLWTGLSSGVAIAALTLAELWLGLFVVSGSKDPTWTFANIVKFTLPGLIVYSACWYIVVFRHRDYSLYRTLMLVVATFGTVSVVIAAVMIFAGFYVAITLLLAAPQPWKVALFVAWAPFAYALVTAIGAVFLIVPYMIVATPMALFHRLLLLKIFASAGPAAPNIRTSVPIIPSRSL